MGFVVAGAGLQAVVQLSEELVEQVSLGLPVPIPALSASLEMSFGAGRGAQCGQCPDGACGCETIVLDATVLI